MRGSFESEENMSKGGGRRDHRGGGPSLWTVNVPAGGDRTLHKLLGRHPATPAASQKGSYLET